MSFPVFSLAIGSKSSCTVVYGSVGEEGIDGDEDIARYITLARYDLLKTGNARVLVFMGRNGGVMEDWMDWLSITGVVPPFQYARVGYAW